MELIRDIENEFGTFGTIELPNGKTIQTLELNWDNNKTSISCIPLGHYQCEVINSPKFGRVYEVKNVPDRTHILIHKGNWIENTNGCILLGLSRSKNGILKSKLAFDMFMQGMGNKPFKLEVKNDQQKRERDSLRTN